MINNQFNYEECLVQWHASRYKLTNTGFLGSFETMTIKTKMQNNFN